MILKLDMRTLADQMNKIYIKNKRDPVGIGTGDDIKSPSFYIKAPAPVKQALSIHYPGRRIVQIAGKPNSGKTTLAMLAMVEAQKGHYDSEMKYIEEGVYVILVDTEGKFSKSRFKKMGGDPDKIFKIGASTLEDAFYGMDNAFSLIYAQDPKAKILLIFDSIGGTPSSAEAEADADDSIQLATAAKVLKRNFRVLVPKWLDKHDIAIIVVNTTYANIGSVGRSNSGGDGLEFASAAIMQLGRIGDITKTEAGKDIQVGIKSRLTMTKNHLQDSDKTIKRLDFEVYAYEVKAADAFTVKKGTSFLGDNHKLTIIKVGSKTNEVTYQKMFYKEETEGHGVLTVIGKEEFLKFLEDGSYEEIEETKED